MTSETVIAAGYAGMLLAVALTIDWLSAHTHRRSLRYRTAGFDYRHHEDLWVCPEGEHLWPHEFDHERRLVRYRAKAHICNGCRLKEHCTDSDEGREIVRPMDPWPHSEAGRFHRVISLTLVVLAGLIAAVALTRNHAPADSAALGALVVVSAFMVRLLARDLRRHPANFPWRASSAVAEKPQETAGFSGWRTAPRERRLNR